MEIYSIAEMQTADKLAMNAGISGLFLMEQAGFNLTRHIESVSEGPCHVTIAAGPGNNGGDAFVVARLLHERAYKIDMFELCLDNKQQEMVKSDARVMREKWLETGGIIHSLSEGAKVKQSLSSATLFVDGLFGAGLNREIEEPLCSLFDEINQSNLIKIAIDMPSGVNGDTGQVMGRAIAADITCSFHQPKQGHVLYPGRNICGKLFIDDIGIPKRVNNELTVKQHINLPELWQSALEQRTSNSHKYHHGSVLVVSGDQTMQGAAALSANAAVKSGAGLVTMVTNTKESKPHPKSYAAIMLASMETNDSDQHWQSLIGSKKVSASLIGPGSLANETTRQKVVKLIENSQRVVLDAGAITAFAKKRELLTAALKKRETAEPFAILTPHEGEFKGLFPELKGANKIDAARKAAKELNVVIVLKGADTVIASPEGQIAVNVNAPSTLATAGTGDVLAGIIVALSAKNKTSLWKAAAAGVYIHAECANNLKTELVADELIEEIAKVKQDVMLND